MLQCDSCSQSLPTIFMHWVNAGAPSIASIILDTLISLGNRDNLYPPVGPDEEVTKPARASFCIILARSSTGMAYSPAISLALTDVPIGRDAR